MDHPIYTEYLLCGRLTTWKFIVDRADAVGSFVTHSKKRSSLEHCRATDNTTLAYIFLRMSTLRFMMLVRSVVESAGTFINEVWLEEYFRAVETFSVNSDDVSEEENAGLTLATCHCRFEHCIVIQTNVAQYLFGNWNNLPLCGGSERVHLLSEDLQQILCKITSKWSQRRQFLRHVVVPLISRHWSTKLYRIRRYTII